MKPKDLKDFIDGVKKVYTQAHLHTKENSITSIGVLNRIISRLEASITSIHEAEIALVQETNGPAFDTLTRILNELHILCRKVERMLEKVVHNASELSKRSRYRAEVNSTGSVGRPKYRISEEQLRTLRKVHFSWADISRLLGVSTSTLWRRRDDFDMLDENEQVIISDDELDVIVKEMSTENPRLGSVLIEGSLKSKGINVSRKRIHQSLTRVDPVITALRRNPLISRRQYWVPGPNSLWHIDGNHKLIRWRIVVHGGIDGFSRLCVFLGASTNNRADTVARQFVIATEEYSWPSRLRTDKGGENVEIGRLMVERRGEGRGSWLQGPSTHNQRIERLWVDVKHGCLLCYIDLFLSLEAEGLLDATCDEDMFALHYVFIPRINAHLQRFRQMWNNHKIRTMNSKSPNQLYISGMLQLYGSDYTAIRDVFDCIDTVNEESYGVHTSTLNREDPPTVIIPPTVINHAALIRNSLQDNINPLERCIDQGRSLYIRAKDICNQSRTPEH